MLDKGFVIDLGTLLCPRVILEGEIDLLHFYPRVGAVVVKASWDTASVISQWGSLRCNVDGVGILVIVP